MPRIPGPTVRTLDDISGSGGTAAFSLLQRCFGDPVMADIFSEEALVRFWLEVEAALAITQGELGLIPTEHASMIASACASADIDYAQLWAETVNVGYPILPLVRSLSGQLPDGPNGSVHFGATTQDIMDSGLALQLRDALDRAAHVAIQLGDRVAALVTEHGDTVMAGRTHAQQALPITLGAKLAVFLNQLREGLAALGQARDRVAIVSLHGAVGTSAGFRDRGGELRTGVGRQLGLAVPVGPWHVARDGLVAYGAAMVSLATVCLRLANEIVDLSRTELGEVRERGGHLRGASSTMPQKANPIDAEMTVGFAAAATSCMSAMYRAMEAGHERAAGEWQIEWHVLPQLSTSTAGALVSAYRMLGGLEVDRGRMATNLELERGRLLSEAHMLRLAEHLGRERAHDIVYAAAVRSRAEDLPLEIALSDELGGEPVEGIDAKDYLGEAMQASAVAVECWRRERDENQARTRRVQ
jgi:3-carboxy-cis,cis-muconate cycloisomerase